MLKFLEKTRAPEIEFKRFQCKTKCKNVLYERNPNHGSNKREWRNIDEEHLSNPCKNFFPNQKSEDYVVPKTVDLKD
jgi:hypothetical protein